MTQTFFEHGRGLATMGVITMNATTVPCSFAADLRRFERFEIDAEHMSVALLDEAHDEFLSGACRPYTPANLAEALTNLRESPRADRLMQELAALASDRDAEAFGRRLLASIEDYWQAESVRIALRRAA